MIRTVSLGLFAAAVLAPAPTWALSGFTPGDLVVSVEGAGVQGGTASPYLDNQAAPLSLFEFLDQGTTSASYVGSEVLPQTGVGSNIAVSGEYGSSSEGLLQRSVDGRYLTIMGYGVNAAVFNADPTAFGTATTGSTTATALGQSGSLTGQGYIAVPRVVALIGANGSVDSSTALYNIYNGNNPRSVVTVDGTSFYVSGQGDSPDPTGGVFYAAKGATSATAITGLDTNAKTSAQDTRVVEIYNSQLYVSVDSKEGSGSNRDFIGTLGQPGALPTSLANGGNGPAQIPEPSVTSNGKLTLTAGTSNGVNAAGQQINLSPESFFFANSTTLYIADSGASKNTSASSPYGDGGLQKWLFSNGQWSLAYTLSAGLDLVDNANSPNTPGAGVTGLLGLTGQVVGDEVELYATSYTLGDTDQSYLYGITDELAAATKPTDEVFSTLADAPMDSNFKGVAFAPVSPAPEPSTWALMILGVSAAGASLRLSRRAKPLVD